MKEDELVQFDLERLKGNKVAVNCKTEAEAQNFVSWVNSLGKDLYNITRWIYYKENTWYCLKGNLHWDKDSKSSFEEVGYEIISYEEALAKEPLSDELQKDKKINNLHKMLVKKDSKIENQAKELSELLKINKELKDGVTSDLNTENKVNEKIDKLSRMNEGQLNVHENEIKRLHTIIHYLEEKCLKVYED